MGQDCDKRYCKTFPCNFTFSVETQLILLLLIL